MKKRIQPEESDLGDGLAEIEKEHYGSNKYLRTDDIPLQNLIAEPDLEPD